METLHVRRKWDDIFKVLKGEEKKELPTENTVRNKATDAFKHEAEILSQNTSEEIHHHQNSLMRKSKGSSFI